MAKKSNQKLKSLYIMKILFENTDEEHGISLRELIMQLEQYGIFAERKSVYRDIDSLIEYGIDIKKEKTKSNCLYHVVNREFELVELKMLVDAVQSAKFITEKQSRNLIKKIAMLTSKHQAKELQGQVWIQDRLKTMNEKVYYAIDQISTAIHKNQEIQFRYCKWKIERKVELQQVDTIYQVHPWQMVWEDGNYYLIGCDLAANQIKHFRIDKMLEVSIKSSSVDRNYFGELNRATYTRKHFKMFDGQESTVELVFHNRLIGVVMDRFGREGMIRPVDDNHFKLVVDIVISNPFWGWIVSCGDDVRVVGPAKVVEQFRQFVDRLYKRYLTEKG